MRNNKYTHYESEFDWQRSNAVVDSHFYATRLQYTIVDCQAFDKSRHDEQIIHYLN